MTTEATLDNVAAFGGQDNSATSGERVRSRTPRELLRKVPRRVSMGLDSSSRGATPSNDDHDPTNSRSPTPQAVATKFAAMDVSSTKGGSENQPPPACSFELSEPVMMKANVPIQSPRLTKPTATKAGLDIDGTSKNSKSPLKPTEASNGAHSNFNVNDNMGASMVYQKPSDPFQEQAVRKLLMLQSRRKSYPVGGGHAKEAIALVKLQPAMAVARPWRQDQVTAAFRSTGMALTTNGFAMRPTKPKHKAVPVRGWRNGEFILTGIVECTHGITGKKHFFKLDDPFSLIFHRNYHLMGRSELETELCCYKGASFARSKGILAMQVMDLTTGLPILPSTHQETRDIWSTTPLPHQQSPDPFGVHPSQHSPQDHSRRAKSLSPATVSAGACAAAAAIDFELSDRASKFGLADIKGKEAFFYSDPEIHRCSQFFPYHINADNVTDQVSVQAIRAGDEVKVVVCGLEQRPIVVGSATVETDNIVHETMWMAVESVTSFGQVTAKPLCVSRLIPQTLHPEAFVSFPSTAVVGVCYGKNWKH